MKNWGLLRRNAGKTVKNSIGNCVRRNFLSNFLLYLQNMTLETFHNIPFRTQDLAYVFPDNKDLPGAARRLEQSGKIIRLKKGLYVVPRSVSRCEVSDFLIANHLYGPSYISSDTALRWYGLIPESVYETLSVTTGIARTYRNPTGTYRYLHAAPPYYSVGVTMRQEGDTFFLIASPEKALCDKIVFTPFLNLRYRMETLRFLEEDLRFDMEGFFRMDVGLLKECAATSRKKTMIHQLIKLIENEQRV